MNKFNNYYGKRTFEYIVPEQINQSPKEVRVEINPKNA